MKQGIRILLGGLFLTTVGASTGFALDTKSIDLEKDGVVVTAALDSTIRYLIDTVACICWVRQSGSGGPVISTVDCSKLKAYEKLRESLSKCK